MSLRVYGFIFSWLACAAAHSATNPDFFYFHNGDTPENWQWVLADPDKGWWAPLSGNEGAFAGGKLTMEASNAAEFPGAVKLIWSKKGEWGSVKITGRTVDLSRFEHTAELVLALKLEDRTKKDVKVKMECGDKCEGEVNIVGNLKKVKLNEWFVLPIPLDCFVEQGLDLKNITSPFSIGTDGKMILHVAEIAIQQMAVGDEGCVPNKPVAGPAKAAE
jgi:hypothetical protein